MLTAYFRLSQEGIEPLKKYKPLVKDKDSSHYFHECRVSRFCMKSCDILD